jgi:hypothetical protein
VIPLGLEPRTLSLKVRCSNQLSYEIKCKFLNYPQNLQTVPTYD